VSHDDISLSLYLSISLSLSFSGLPFISDPLLEFFIFFACAVNCVDRHAQTHPDKAALIWEKNKPEETTHIVTYRYSTGTEAA